MVALLWSPITQMADTRFCREFPKALWACTIAEVIVFSIVGGVVYAYTGNQYMTAPAFGSLEPLYKKVAFSFMIPTLIFLGVLYASVSTRFIFFRIFDNSRHKNEHTVLGWSVWALILRTSSPSNISSFASYISQSAQLCPMILTQVAVVTWILAFIIAEVIPFFSDRASMTLSIPFSALFLVVPFMLTTPVV